MLSFRKSIIFTIAILIFLKGFGQRDTLPFYNDILAFKKQDSISPPAKGSILFIGSSSFTMWKDVQDKFTGYPIVNRGFGGSSIPDVLNYADDIIFPYQPKQIVIYCGENDIASDTVDSKMVAERFKTLFKLIRKRIPGIPVLFISMKPSPSRAKYMHIIKQGNQIIKNFLWQQGNAGYVDVFSLMLNSYGKPKPELFGADSLHMNERGYAIWIQALQPYLLKK